MLNLITARRSSLKRFLVDSPLANALLWEPRGGWEDKLVRELCRELNLTHVVDPFAQRTQTPTRCYFRLHGRKSWRYIYTDDELGELLTMLPHGKTSYVLFNNVRMRDDALRFQRLIEQDKFQHSDSLSKN